MTRTWKLEEAKTNLSQLVRDAEHEPHVITRHGKPVVVMSVVTKDLLSGTDLSGVGKVPVACPLSTLDALRGNFDFSEMPGEDWLERDRRSSQREREL